MLHLDVYNTHMELYPYTKDDYPALEDMYTAVDKYTNTSFACGFLIDEGRLYLPRGTSISKIEHMCHVTANYINEDDPIEKMERKYYPVCDPRDKIQEESIAFLKEDNHQAALNLQTGLGKAQPLSTKIPTPNGYKLMGDLKVGDKVFGSDGKPITVTAIYPQGVKDIYEITFNDRRKARCCKEHLWQVTHPWSPNKKQVLQLKDIMENYKVYRPSMSRFNPNRKPWEYRYHIPLLSRPVQYDEQPVPIDPYVLGAFIGNGCLREPGLSISSGDSYIPLKIAEICGFDTYKSCDHNYTWMFRYKNEKRRVQTKEFFKYLPEFINKLSIEKTIPEVYMYNSLDVRMKLLQGLLDTDGTIRIFEGRYDVSYCSCSKRLLEQIRELIIGLGFICNISSPDKRVDKYTNGYHATVQIRVPNPFKQFLFTHPRKLEIAMKAANRQDIKQKFKYLKIIDIQKVGEEECQCIMVDSEDHLYVTEDFIVTHNTYCVAYTSTELNECTLIITPNESLKQQWIKTYHDMFGVRDKHMLNISGSDIIEMFMNDMIDPCDIYFVNHQTLRSYLSQTNGYALHQFFKKLNIGIKVYDEAHMEFLNILLIDFFSNTKRTWYLTATFDRSDKSQSACFKRAFNNLVAYGELQSEKVTVKHVIYHIVNINSRISPKERARVIGYQGVNSTSYGKYAFITDTKSTAYQAILMILKKIKDVEGKTLIFVPLIDAVEDIVRRLKIEHPEKSVAAYHSKVSKEDKESAIKKDIIVSTIKSCGTGRDIPGLRSVICCDAIASKVLIQQVIGRLRPYAPDKDTYFFDIIDRSIPQLTYFFRARYKKIETLVKDVITLDIEK